MVFCALLSLAARQFEIRCELVEREDGRLREKRFRPLLYLTICAHTWDNLPLINTNSKVIYLFTGVPHLVASTK